MTTPASRRAAQGGFTLLIVLVAIGFFSLILVALLNLVTTDTRSTTAFRDTASLRRSADAALQVGTTRLKTASSTQLATSGSCAGVDGSTTTVEAHAVTVRCAVVPSNDLPVASPGDGGTVLTLLGNYNGTLDDGVYNEVDGVMQPVVSGLATWLNNLVANGPGLIHAGSEPLRVAGDVRVRQSTLGLIAPAQYPAIDVAGSYQQGDRGFLGGLDFGFFGSTRPCGVLTETIGGTEYGLRLRATSQPQCKSGSNADRESVAPAAGPAVTPAKTWTPAAIAAAAQSAGTCVSNSVKTFSPGSYNAAQTALMNQWFQKGNGSCDNVTFWFQPGDYYFETAGSFDGDPRAIVFRDDTSSWVFGVPKGWSAAERAAADDFPEACDRSVDGVSITLSPSTSIKHKAGRVAICGKAGYPAIYQPAGGVNQAWAGEPDTATALPAGPASTSFAPLDAMTRTIAGPAPAPAVPAGYPAAGKPYDNSEGTTEAQRKSGSGTCSGAGTWCAISTDLSGFGNPNDAAPSGPLSSALLKLRGTAAYVIPYANFPYNNTLVYTLVTITFNDGTGQSCQVKAADVPRSMTAPKIIDLLKAPGPTSDILTNSCIALNGNPALLSEATRLQNATIRISELVVVESCGIFCTSTATVNLDYAWLETVTSSVLPPSPFGTTVAPNASTSLNVYGNVVMPRSQIEVKWAGDANREPIFVGSVVARGLASTPVLPSNHVGVLVARTLAAPARRIRLTAEIDGKVRGTAEVLVHDTDDAGLLYAPGHTLEVVDWKL